MSFFIQYYILLKNDSLLPILRFPGYFETPLFRTFFHFPLGLRNSGVQLYFMNRVHSVAAVASHAGVFRGARISSLKTSAWEAIAAEAFSLVVNQLQMRRLEANVANECALY